MAKTSFQFFLSWISNGLFIFKTICKKDVWSLSYLHGVLHVCNDTGLSRFARIRFASRPESIEQGSFSGRASGVVTAASASLGAVASAVAATVRDRTGTGSFAALARPRRARCRLQLLRHRRRFPGTRRATGGRLSDVPRVGAPGTCLPTRCQLDLTANLSFLEHLINITTAGYNFAIGERVVRGDRGKTDYYHGFFEDIKKNLVWNP